MKKITTKRYRITNGAQQLFIVDVAIHSADTVQEVMKMIDEDGVLYKIFDTQTINGNIVSKSHFAKDGSMKYQDLYAYYENGVLKERKTLNPDG